MAGRNPHPAAIFFVFFRKAPSDGRFRGAFSDEEGEERQQPAELAQGGGHVAFDGFDAEVEPLGDLLVGKLFVTAQAENPAATAMSSASSSVSIFSLSGASRRSAAELICSCMYLSSTIEWEKMSNTALRAIV